MTMRALFTCFGLRYLNAEYELRIVILRRVAAGHDFIFIDGQAKLRIGYFEHSIILGPRT